MQNVGFTNSLSTITSLVQLYRIPINKIKKNLPCALIIKRETED